MSTTWTRKFVLLRSELEEIERDRADCSLVKNTENNISKAWNAIWENYSTLKKVATVVSSIFSSTYSCESLFSEMNFIKSDLRNRLTDECSAACTLLKVTDYEPNINKSTSSVQQKEIASSNSLSRYLSKTIFVCLLYKSKYLNDIYKTKLFTWNIFHNFMARRE